MLLAESFILSSKRGKSLYKTNFMSIFSFNQKIQKIFMKQPFTMSIMCKNQTDVHYFSPSFFFCSQPLENLFIFCPPGPARWKITTHMPAGPGPLKKSLFICRSAPARSKNRLSFADQTRCKPRIVHSAELVLPSSFYNRIEMMYP